MARKESVNKLEKVVSLGKRRGFIYQGSEIYGGLAGTYDYGPLGVLLKKNLLESWRRFFILGREEMLELDAAILMNAKVFAASGHLQDFGGLMFQTSVGQGEAAAVAYLRPETAQGIFVNFKNIVDSCHPKLPFGVAQIGKAFRNEIAPRDWLFRLREFEQMEIEYFVRPGEWETAFEQWRQAIGEWLKSLGLKAAELEVPEKERAHYSKRTIDFEYDFPFGRQELCGLAYRADYDLKRHQEYSKQDLTYFDEESGERFLPQVVEPTFGVDRLVLAILNEAYDEDLLDGEKRVVLRLKPELAPIKVAVFPLLRNKPALVQKARQIFGQLKTETWNLITVFDDHGNIGKRYRRQDEIGTPHCLTVDFQTLQDDTFTLRDRDSGKQVRVKIEEAISWLERND